VVGQTVGNYRIISKLGEGGVGEVYLAEHPDIGRKVAIKFVRRALAEEPTLYGRFMGEARAANAIQHPNIVEVLDFGRLADGQPYIVMEYLPGESLAARLERLGPLPVAAALDLAAQVAGVLAAAHAKAIVHRDLKPDNVFLVASRSSAGGEAVKVLDFGIAKLQGSLRDGSPHTRTGSLLGTPVYMSPEQCRGIREIDARTDIYALGVMLFEMVAGRPPFVSEGLGDLMDMHMNREPPLLRSLVPSAPRGLEALIARALAKRPEDRFTSAADLQAVLQDLAVAGGGRISGAVVMGASGTPAPVVDTPSSAIAVRHPAQITAGTLVGQEGPARGPRRSATRWLAVGGGVLAVLVTSAVLWPARSTSGPSPATTEASPAPLARVTDRPARPAPPPAALSPPAPAAASPTPAAAAPAIPEAPPTVSLRIESQPGEAAVVDARTGAALGKTPLSLTRPRGDGVLQLRLTRAGFRPATINLPLARDGGTRVALPPQPRRPPRASSTAGLDEL
jgi:serine/threonine-protein kinase